MTDQNNKGFDLKKSPETERETSASEQRKHFKMENAPAPEKKEVSIDEKIVTDELKREIEMMQLDEASKGEAEKLREKIEYLGEKEKIEHLFQIAREKGVVFAVQLAKKMNEPYLLDVLHDALAREGYYQKLGQTDDDQQNSQTINNSTK